MRSKKYFNFIIFFFVSGIFYGIEADSYPKYRMDDASLLGDGIIPVRSRGRADQTSEDPPKWKLESGFYSSIYIWGKGDSQKGGVREDQARKSYGRGSVSPEIGWMQKTEASKTLFLVSPILTYAERDESKREIYKVSDGEILASFSHSFSFFQLRGEGGRGFQRLDKSGFLFANIMNYAELGWEILPWKLRGSFIGGEYHSSFGYSDRDKTESPLRIGGVDLVWEPEKLFQSLRFFHYQYGEPRQEAVKADLYRGEERFRPYGFYRYSGLEWESVSFAKTKWEGSAIHVEGRRENGTSSFDSYKSRGNTNAWLATLGATWKEETFLVFLRAMYASKDPTFHTDQNSDGYSPIKGDPRGFLAPFSILLLRDFTAKQDSPFSGVDSPRKPVFENAGLQYYQFGTSKEWGKGWSTTLATGLGISYIGRGVELIAAGGWKGEIGYAVVGLAYARVNPEKDEAFLFEEIKRPVPNRDYFRWYASAGMRF